MGIPLQSPRLRTRNSLLYATLGAVAVLLFAPFFLEGRVLWSQDIDRVYYPVASLLRETLRTGELSRLLWCRELGAGFPLLADGVCTLAGWWGGLGRAVRLRHANGYETIYGHLSRLHVRRGERVVQGRRIGAVGSSGLATGPHLDYRMRQNGRYVDPLKVQLPPAEPIPPTPEAPPAE